MPRKQKKYHYLYKTTNLINGKFYVGMHSTDDLEDEYLGSGKYLRNSINYHGKENFKKEILEFFDTREILMEKEKDFVNKDFIKDPLCMNLHIGGNGNFPFSTTRLGSKTSEETKQLQSKARKKWISKSTQNVPWNKGKTNVYSNDVLEKMRIASIGNTNLRGKTWSSEAKKKNSLLKQGKKTHDNFTTARQVEQYDINNNFIAKYKNIKTAVQTTGCSMTCIIRVCKGERKQTKGFIWKYIS
jgi:hypothetical protein